MAHDTTAARGDVWDRWDRIWHGLFYVSLAVPTAITATDGALTGATRGAALAVAIGFAAWHWFWILRRPELVGRTWPSLAFVVGAGIFAWVLMGMSQSYTFLIYGLFPQMFISLNKWGAVPAAALTVMVFVRTGSLQSGDLRGNVVPLLGSIGLAVGIGLFIEAIARQSDERKQALEALEAARDDLAAASKQAGVLQERQRLAREMHDTVAQGLSSVVMLLEAADQALPPGAQRAQAHLDQARAVTREALLEVRLAVMALRPEALREAPLPAALTQTVQRWADQQGIAATTRVTGGPHPLPPEAEVSLLRAAQEAMSNIAKHADARTVTVTLSFVGDAVVLDVHDDGAGFDATVTPEGDLSGGFGLKGLRERLHELGGELVVESDPKEGTTVVATVPTAPHPAPAETR